MGEARKVRAAAVQLAPVLGAGARQGTTAKVCAAVAAAAREGAALVPGIRPINPLDVLDLVLLHRRDKAFILNTWTL